MVATLQHLPALGMGQVSDSSAHTMEAGIEGTQW